MSVRAKFRVTKIERQMAQVRQPDGQYRQAEIQTIVLAPVVGNGKNPENDRFFAFTPSGEIRLGTVNEEAARQFELEGEYYVDFIPAEV